jgi:hypothetical protein
MPGCHGSQAHGTRRPGYQASHAQAHKETHKLTHTHKYTHTHTHITSHHSCLRPRSARVGMALLKAGNKGMQICVVLRQYTCVDIYAPVLLYVCVCATSVFARMPCTHCGAF